MMVYGNNDILMNNTRIFTIRVFIYYDSSHNIPKCYRHQGFSFAFQ